ncbi:putative transcriptional activator srcap-like protein [Fusarium austroafricanum]|uniref:Putative transcriptional activator srcap-like protein n=1 Tax=Fusarium austroafricanum TaxID=2364996 RepID=A0A8H4NNM7_9HYPO|nr:putative transcriptional activator srcap-like protein [Fusarium austroafricanum]
MVNVSPYQDALMASPIPGAKRTATKASATDDKKFYIYSQAAGKPPGTNVHTISGSEINLEKFLGFLPDKGIVLAAKPDGTSAKFDDSDPWATWMTNWDEHSTLSIDVDDKDSLNIQSFNFEITAPWKITFSSSDPALSFAFGGDDFFTTSTAKVPKPGMTNDGTPLYFGLDPKRTLSDLKSTVGDLFKHAGLLSIAEVLPHALLDRGVSLKREDAGRERNAMWFRPENQFETIMRLRFTLDDNEELNGIFDKVLRGLEFTEAAMILTISKALCVTNKGHLPLSSGGIEFEINASIRAKDRVAELLVGLEIFPTGYSLVFQFNSDSQDDDPLTTIILWLLDLLPDPESLNNIKELLGKENFFTSHIHLRQVRIDLDTSEGEMQLESVCVDIEVSTDKFGVGNDQSKRIPFLVTYCWTRGIGSIGTLLGRLWNGFNTDQARVLSPRYEKTTDLQPLTQSPADSIDLPSLIAGHKIENIPKNVPTELTQASIEISAERFAVGAMLQSKRSGNSEESSVPQLDLGQIMLQASFEWGKKTNFQLDLGITTLLHPGQHSKHQETAALIGSMSYNSGNWQLMASISDLYGSNLYELFDSDSVDTVIPLIDSLLIKDISFVYNYSKGAGSSFNFRGDILLGELELKLKFDFDQTGWTFTAELAATDKQATIGDIVSSIIPSDDLDLPPFLADTPFSGKSGEGGIFLDVANHKGEASTFVSRITIWDLTLLFAQVHMSDWDPKLPSKRLINVSFVSPIDKIDIPLIGNIPQPFDEIYLLWVQDNTKKSPVAGLTRKELKTLKGPMGEHTPVMKDKFKDQKETDVLATAGAHFAVIMKDGSGNRTCILDYDFKKKTASPKTGKEVEEKPAAPPAEGSKDEGKPDSDGSSSSAPLKKKAGPLSISNIGLKYANKQLGIKFTATFDLGPLAFSLIGFQLNFEINGLKSIKPLLPSLEGLSASFEKPPLTIAGIIRHGKEGNTEYYAGGLIIGWVPYQIEAAGFYGECIPEGGTKDQMFRSVFVFAKLDGPLITLEFAEISGLTGGFGYNSEVRTPAPDQVVNFPFVKSTALDNADESALKSLERLTSPSSDGWFKPSVDTYWAAAGLKVDAFQMISLDAVAVVQFGESIIMGIYAVALVDIPNSNSKAKLAHVELGIAVVVDLAHGFFKAEAQLSPKSFILHPDCHLTGGFALYYWFDPPSGHNPIAGEFVYTLGGYHQGFDVPAGYPNPPRLGISWNLGSNLSITGQAYFAITPKVAMAGGRLHAAFHAGPISAWFDAFANFLIKYQPFFFKADIGICVGVAADLDFLFIHAHISGEFGAELALWGPPVAGRVTVDIKVYKFHINFGDSDSGNKKLSLSQFYELVLQASSQTGGASALAEPAPSRITEIGEDEEVSSMSVTTPPENQGHTFLAQSGLMNDSDRPQRDPNEPWTVRGGTFSFVIGCKMAVSKAEQIKTESEGLVDSVEYNKETIYSKPMELNQPLQSTMEFTITQDEAHDKKVDITGWDMDSELKSVPTGLWAQCKYRLFLSLDSLTNSILDNGHSDPVKSGNNIDSLMSPKDGGVTLMMGVSLIAPPPQMSNDKLQTFKILDANLERIIAKKGFPDERKALRHWDPVEPLKDDSIPDDGPGKYKKQFEEVHKKWVTPDWKEKHEGDDVQTDSVSRWAKAFNWDESLSKFAKIPDLVNKRFKNLYLEAPLLTQ